MKHYYAQVQANIRWLMLLLFMMAQMGQASAQNNLTMKSYRKINTAVDVTVLDAIFGTVTIHGSVVTSDYLAPITPPASAVGNWNQIPTTVAGFGGVQVVHLNSDAGSGTLSQAQADALIAFVKGGGVLIANLEGAMVSTVNEYAVKYIGEALFCGNVFMGSSSTIFGGITPAPAYQPGNGTLLLNGGATSIPTTTSNSIIAGAPSESIVYMQQLNANACNNLYALDIVVPSYPGISGGNNTCGVLGMALLSGEASGILTSDATSVATRDNSQSNANYAQLIYDFLYSPSAMATRRAWATVPGNTNPTCPPNPVCTAVTTTSPASATGCIEAQTNFTVTPSGTGPFTYQWYFNGNPLSAASSDGNATYSGGTSQIFSITPHNTSFNGAQFTVKVTNSCGNVTSNAGVFTIASAPTITTSPASAATCVGSSKNFTVTPAGTGPFSYQWYFNGNPLSATASDANATYSGGTSQTFSITPNNTSFNAAQFTVKVTNACGNVTSNAATLTVNPLPTTPVITTIAPTCAVLTGSVTVSAPVSGITYTLSPGGATSTTGIFSGLAAGSGPYTVTGSNGTCSSAASNSVSVGAAATNCPVPDLRPIISMPTRNFIKTSQMSRPMTIRVYNIGPVGTTTTGTIRVYLSLGSNFTATLSTGSAWTITDDGGGEYTLSTTSAIPRASTAVPSDIPLIITAAAGVTKGSYNLSLAIEDLAGGETNIVNNGATADINVALD